MIISPLLLLLLLRIIRTAISGLILDAGSVHQWWGDARLVQRTRQLGGLQQYIGRSTVLIEPPVIVVTVVPACDSDGQVLYTRRWALSDTLGRRSFYVAAPAVWNALPPQPRSSGGYRGGHAPPPRSQRPNFAIAKVCRIQGWKTRF